MPLALRRGRAGVGFGRRCVGLLLIRPAIRPPPEHCRTSRQWHPPRAGCWPASCIRQSRSPCCCWPSARCSVRCGPITPGRFWSSDPKEVSGRRFPAGLSGRAALAGALLAGQAISVCAWRPSWCHGHPLQLVRGQFSLGRRAAFRRAAGAGGVWQVGSVVLLQWLFLAAAAGRYQAEAACFGRRIG